MEPSDDRRSVVPAALPDNGLLLDLGPQPGKQIKRLKEGKGALAYQVQAAIEDARSRLGIDADVAIIPVVLLYRQSEPDYVVLVHRE
jgi:hypothetical protein